MACSIYRDELSARLDGEEPSIGDELLDRHLATCMSCASFARSTQSIHRAIRVRAAEPIPDLHASILDRIEPLAPSSLGERSESAISWTRYVLAVLGLTMIILSIPSLVLHGSNDALHMSRELGAWDAAFGAGLLFAAWQPARARGLFPMAAALAGFMILAASIDVITGRATFVDEYHHVLELSGVAALWYLAHLVTPGSTSNHGRRIGQLRGVA